MDSTDSPDEEIKGSNILYKLLKYFIVAACLGVIGLGVYLRYTDVEEEDDAWKEIFFFFMQNQITAASIPARCFYDEDKDQFIRLDTYTQSPPCIDVGPRIYKLLPGVPGYNQTFGDDVSKVEISYPTGPEDSGPLNGGPAEGVEFDQNELVPFGCSEGVQTAPLLSCEGTTAGGGRWKTEGLNSNGEREASHRVKCALNPPCNLDTLYNKDSPFVCESETTVIAGCNTHMGIKCNIETSDSNPLYHGLLWLCDVNKDYVKFGSTETNYCTNVDKDIGIACEDSEVTESIYSLENWNSTWLDRYQDKYAENMPVLQACTYCKYYPPEDAANPGFIYWGIKKTDLGTKESVGPEVASGNDNERGYCGSDYLSEEINRTDCAAGECTGTENPCL